MTRELEQQLIEMTRELVELKRRVVELERREPANFRGNTASDHTTTTLPYHGDFGYQTTKSEIQFNAAGTIKGVVIA